MLPITKPEEVHALSFWQCDPVAVSSIFERDIEIFLQFRAESFCSFAPSAPKRT